MKEMQPYLSSMSSKIMEQVLLVDVSEHTENMTKNNQHGLGKGK